MTAAERPSVTARDLSRRASTVLDRVEHGERLLVTRDGEPIAEIIPIDRSERTLARWVKDGLVAAPPAKSSAKAGTFARAARRRLSPQEPGPTATEVLLQMREDERP